MNKISEILRMISAKVEKGDVRNTVLRQVNALEKVHKLLGQGRNIKEKEISEYKDSKKGEILKKQVSIISSGMEHIKKAIEGLKDYKDLTTSDL